MEMFQEVEENKLHNIANIHNLLEMWQGTQTPPTPQKESHTQNKHMTAIGYILDTEEILTASWLNSQHDGVPKFKLSVWSPLPSALLAKHLPGEQTQLKKVRRI